MTISVKKKRKLFQVAKELNVSHGTIQEFLEKKGIVVKNINMVIDDPTYEIILQRFAHEKREADRIHKRRQEKKREKAVATVPVQTARPEPPVTAEAPEGGEPPHPVEDKKAAEIEVAEATEQVVKDQSGQHEELPPAESSEEAPALEKPPVEDVVETAAPVEPPAEAAQGEPDTEEPVSADSESAQREGPALEVDEEATEEASPQVGDIIDHPMAKKYLEKKRQEEAQKRERQRKVLERLKKKGKETAGSESEAGEATTTDLEQPAVVPEVSERRKSRKEKKKKQRLEEEEREERRRKALEMIRREGKKMRRPVDLMEEEEAPEAAVEAKPAKKKREKKKKQVDQKEVEEALRKTLAEMRDSGTGKKRRKRTRTQEEEVGEEENLIRVTEFITTQDLANLMNVSPAEIIQKCLELGLVVTINQRLDMDTIKLLAEEFGYKVEEEEEFASDILEELEEEEDRPEDLKPRAPIVTVMGHVDHGKTSLLDFIRKSNVVAGEAGGITQHIGAYEVELEDGRKITFIDTPGHEAFTAMRARGAQVTDIVVLVVAADDRVMPQTEEAIDHARAAGVSIIVAINKVDKPNANPDAIKKQLADRGLLVEDWGGQIQCAEVSAKTGQGVDELLEKILLEAELLDLKANPNKRARGVVLEAKLDKGKGPVATVLVQEGTLRVSDHFVVGQHWGRVRAMLNERGQRVQEAGPSTPIQVLGISGVPEAGDRLIVMKDEKTVREIAQRRQQLKREQDFHTHRLVTLDELSRQIQHGEVKELQLIVKADVDGSAQALADALSRLSNEQVEVKIIRKGVGPIIESDVMLATASSAIIIGFNVRPTTQAKELAEREHVDIRVYRVIYDAIEDVKKALEGLLEPVEREESLGAAEVRETFKISRLGTVAGCYVTTGKIPRNARVRLVRNGVEVYDGRLASLKRFKEDVREVQAGYECGMMLENFNDIKVGDVIEAYQILKEAQKIE